PRGVRGTPPPCATASRLRRQPTLVVGPWLARGEARVRLFRLGCLLLDARAVPQRGLVDGVRAPVRPHRLVPRTDCEDEALRVTGADDRVLLIGRAMHEVPL